MCIQDDLWKRLCRRHNWLLPYAPSVFEQGAWKAHYISCVQNFRPKVQTHRTAPLTQQQTALPVQLAYSSEASEDELSSQTGVLSLGSVPPWRALDPISEPPLEHTGPMYSRLKGLMTKNDLPHLMVKEPPAAAMRSTVRDYLCQAVRGFVHDRQEDGSAGSAKPARQLVLPRPSTSFPGAGPFDQTLA